MSWSMSILLLLMLPLGMWALLTGLQQDDKYQLKELVKCQLAHRLKHGTQTFGFLHKRAVDERPKNNGKWLKRENGKMHRPGIHVINADEEEQQQLKLDRQLEQALKQMKGSKPPQLHIVADVDFRREFASEEPNPYIESQRNNCE